MSTVDPVEIACHLIAQPTPSSETNQLLIDWLAEQVAGVASQTEMLSYSDPAGVKKYNLLVRIGAGHAGGLTFFAHTDTVPPGDWHEGDACAPRIAEGRLYGRGACDMKGPLAAMLAAALAAARCRLERPLYLVFTADEETGYLGAQQVVRRSKLFAELATGVGIVGEPTEQFTTSSPKP